MFCSKVPKTRRLLQITVLLASLILPLFVHQNVSAGSEINRKAFVLVFNPSGPETNNQLLTEYRGWSNPNTLTASTIAKIDEMTHGQVGYTVTETQVVNGIPQKADGFQYTLQTYLDCAVSNVNCHAQDTSDYNKILIDYHICERFNAGEFDELWMFGAPYFGFYESNLAGQNGFWYNSMPTLNTTCVRLMPIMGFNYERAITEIIEDFGHRTESMMRVVYGNTWDRTKVRDNWEKFSLVSTFSPLDGKVAGCGHVHFAPASINDYDWGNTSTVETYCDEFSNYSDGVDITRTRTVSCTEFGCSGIGFFTWWYQHMPHEAGVNSDGKLNNWYYYIFNPNTLYESLVSVAPAISVTSITTAGASISGNVIADGNSAIIERGVAYSTTNIVPTIRDAKFIASGTTGALNASLTALVPSTKYYVRVYATNGIGTTYSEVATFTTLTPLPSTLTNVYFTFGKLRYGRYASPLQLRSGDYIYLKQYDPKKIQLMAISLYDYTLKRNQGYTGVWRNPTTLYMRTNYLLPAKRKYAFIFTFKDRATSVIVKKYFVINTISSSTITL